MTEKPNEDINCDESRVPCYTLPDPLICSDGSEVRSSDKWYNQRRPELLKMFQEFEYGIIPEQKLSVNCEIYDCCNTALDGKAIRKQVWVYFTEAKQAGPKMNILLYLPKHSERCPLFLGLNFYGNHTVISDTSITITSQWVSNYDHKCLSAFRADERSRGVLCSRWPIDQIIARGYGVATIYNGDLYPDHRDGLQDSIIPLFYKDGQTAPEPNQWGAIGAWAWGLSGAMDFCQNDPLIDRSKVIVHGHSRLGKAALWAGALDERFAAVISNNSGCGGAKISKRFFGENVNKINNHFPHWFCANFKKFNNNEVSLPFDQHELLALIAPRPLYIASAENDLNADPEGEFLSAKNADPVYRLLGTEGLAVKVMPPVNMPVHGTVAYHVRSGAHDITEYDWKCFLDFADKHVRKL